MLDWNWKGFDVVGTLRYIDGFHEQDANLNDHYVEHRWLFDIQATYDFSALVSTPPAASAGYSKDDKDKGGPPPAASSEMSIWDHLLKGTTFTVGCNNLFDHDPPFSSGQGGNATAYPGFTYDATGRFVYVRLTKQF